MKDLELYNDQLLELILAVVEEGLTSRKLKISPKQKAALMMVLIKEFRVSQKVIDRWLDMGEVLAKAVIGQRMEIKNKPSAKKLKEARP